MFKFAEKIENNVAPKADRRDQSFLEAEKLLNLFKQEYKKFKETGKSNEEIRNLVNNELNVFVNEFADKIFSDPDEEVVKKSSQMLAKVFSNPYMGISGHGIAKVRDMFEEINWLKWGVDVESSNNLDNVDTKDDNEKNNKQDNKEINIDKTGRINMLFKEVFSFYNLDPKLMMSAWREGIFPNENNKYEMENGLKPEDQKNLVIENLRALATLENERPGSAAILLKEYGLANFGRYPWDLLVSQYDNRDNQELPYGAVIFARQDYNGVLYNKQGVWDELDSSLIWDKSGQRRENRHVLRFMEASGRFGLMLDLVNLNKRYGANHKISFAVLNGHGNAEGMTFGDGPEDRRGFHVAKDDFPEANWVTKVRDFFTEDATLIIESCLVGEKGGLAEEAAKKLKIDILACDRISGGIESIKVNEKNGHLDFKVKFLAERAPLLKKVFKDEMAVRKARKY